jgi:hypothetical protein
MWCKSSESEIERHVRRRRLLEGFEARDGWFRIVESIKFLFTIARL